MGAIGDGELRERAERIGSLIEEIERSAGAEARAGSQELVQAVLDLHGAGLDRICERLRAAGETGRSLLEAMAGDELIGGLFLLHGLHPTDLEARVLEALERARPLLRSHGGDVELLGIADGAVRLRLVGSCHGCPSSAATLKHTIEEAIFERAPDVASIDVEGAAQGPSLTPDGRELVAIAWN